MNYNNDDACLQRRQCIIIVSVYIYIISSASSIYYNFETGVERVRIKIKTIKSDNFNGNAHERALLLPRKIIIRRVNFHAAPVTAAERARIRNTVLSLGK